MSLREPGDYRSNVRDRYSYQPRYEAPGSRHHGVFRFLLFTVLLGAGVLIGLVTIGRPLVASTVVGWAGNNPGTMGLPFVAEFVEKDLGAKLTDPPGDDPTEVQFVVRTGDTVRVIGDRLEAEGFVLDSRAFVLTALRRGADDDFKAGNYVLRRNMRPTEIVSALLEPRELHTFFRVGLREGLRLEQITALLQKLKTDEGLPIDVGAFYNIVKNPPADLVADYPWLKLPKGASLEGYLAAATYQVRDDATAETFVRQLLDQFEKAVGAERLTVPKARGMTLHQIVTLASIVEQEAQVDAERPIIAGVYQNRITKKQPNGGLLQADPTIVYANDTVLLQDIPLAQWVQFFFWDVSKIKTRLDEVALPDSLAGYQTYRRAGLIPGPICTPSVASIAAALAPETKTTSCSSWPSRTRTASATGSTRSPRPSTSTKQTCASTSTCSERGPGRTRARRLRALGRGRPRRPP